jgi:hypothetical protein
MVHSISFTRTSTCIKELATRPTQQDQLVRELQIIYQKVVDGESKCIEMCTKLRDDSKHISDHWEESLKLHQSLLEQYQDFFSCSHHPSAGPELRKLAAKYLIPARMWIHGIRDFLEILGGSVTNEHLLTFIYLVYKQLALLYEMVPAFSNIWAGYLGEVAKYR